MNITERLIELLKRYRRIERDRKNLDFQTAEWARDLRAAVDSDAAFLSWCQIQLGLNEPQAGSLLAKAVAVRVVPDAETWTQLGGWDRQISRLSRLPTRRAQIEAVEEAKTSGLLLATVIARRTPKPDIAPMKTPTSREDAGALAKFLVRHVPREKWSPYIAAILARYADVTATIPARKRAA